MASLLEYDTTQWDPESSREWNGRLVPGFPVSNLQLQAFFSLTLHQTLFMAVRDPCTSAMHKSRGSFSLNDAAVALATLMLISLSGVLLTLSTWMGHSRSDHPIALDIQPRRHLEMMMFEKEAERTPHGCLLLGPVWLPNGDSLFSLEYSDDLTLAWNKTRSRCRYKRMGMSARFSDPIWVKKGSSSGIFIACEPVESQYEQVDIIGTPCSTVGLSSSTWKDTVYAARIESEGVYVWAKGQFFSPKLTPDEACEVSCTFYQPTQMELLKFNAKTCGQEVILCPTPPQFSTMQTSKDTLWVVSLQVGGVPLPSVAVVKLSGRTTPTRQLSGASLLQSKSTTDILEEIQAQRLPARICACTMIYNVGALLKEWIMYHEAIGIDQFFMYDNGSEDNTTAILQELQSEGLRITKVFWPWPKTQEGAFSHCALLARSTCTWTMFADVDEFLYPTKLIGTGNNQRNMSAKGSKNVAYPFMADIKDVSRTLARRLLHQVVLDQELDYLMDSTQHNASRTSKNCTRVGQVQIPCFVFGPSGQVSPPQDGLIMGYKCRMKSIERHKVFLLSQALEPPLVNVVHRFLHLKESYCTMTIKISSAAYFHYKYLAWDDFKLKFKRRAAAYVPDWKENKALNSKDRTPGLGLKEAKPEDWEFQFCQRNDSRLIQLVRRLFPKTEHRVPSLPWLTT